MADTRPSMKRLMSGTGLNHSPVSLPRQHLVAAAFLFVLAFGAYATGWPEAPVQEGDSPQYLEVARDLTDLRLETLHDRSVGYPLLLVLTGSSHEPGRMLFVASLILHLLSVSLLAVVLRAAGAGGTSLLLFCGVLLLPPYVEPAGHVMTENLAQFTLAAGLAALVVGISRRRPLLLAVSAAAFAYAALTRPAYQALAIALGGCLLLVAAFLRERTFTLRYAAGVSAVLVAGTLLAVGLASWANYRAFGYFGLVPMTGYHLSTKTASLFERLPDEYAEVREILIRARDVEITRRGGTHTGTQTVWQARAELLAATGFSKAELSEYLLRMNLILIRRAPVEYLQEVARSMALYWFPAAGGLASMQSTLLRWLWAAVHLAVLTVFFMQIVALVGVSIFDLSRRMAASWGLRIRIHATRVQLTTYFLAATIVFYTMILSCVIDIGEARQRRPTDALIILMCFVGATIWRQNLRETGDAADRGFAAQRPPTAVASGTPRAEAASRT